MVLVIRQPDLGTSLMFPAILLGMLYIAGARPRYLAAAVLLGVLSVPTLYFLGDQLSLLHRYQLRRIEAFMDQGDQVAGAAPEQLQESLIAIGSGGLRGKGFGKGTQNTLGRLPERHTDFIFSIIAEEWGFVGAATVTVLLLFLVLLILRVAVLTREPFGRLAVTGVGVAFAAQSLENLGMTMGLTPITGIPLPFVSHGGSSLVVSYLALAVAFNVATRRVRVMAPKDLDPEADVPGPVLVPSRAAGLLQHRWPVE
jgi:rod shape determining protein RodA